MLPPGRARPALPRRKLRSRVPTLTASLLVDGTPKPDIRVAPCPEQTEQPNVTTDDRVV
jgi:hypothetical protein